jgi:hypothetical protein
MKRAIYLLFAFTSRNLSAQGDDVEILTKLNQDWLRSIVEKDTTTLGRILARDFVLVAPNGKKMTRRDNLENLFKQDVASIHIDSVRVRILTLNSGVITAYTTFVFNNDGKSATGQNCYQDIYLKRNGKWVAVSAHVTLLNLK